MQNVYLMKNLKFLCRLEKQGTLTKVLVLSIFLPVPLKFYAKFNSTLNLTAGCLKLIALQVKNRIILFLIAVNDTKQKRSMRFQNQPKSFSTEILRVCKPPFKKISVITPHCPFYFSKLIWHSKFSTRPIQLIKGFFSQSKSTKSRKPITQEVKTKQPNCFIIQIRFSRKRYNMYENTLGYDSSQNKKQYRTFWVIPESSIIFSSKL